MRAGLPTVDVERTLIANQYWLQWLSVVRPLAGGVDPADQLAGPVYIVSGTIAKPFVPPVSIGVALNASLLAGFAVGFDKAAIDDAAFFEQ